MDIDQNVDSGLVQNQHSGQCLNIESTKWVISTICTVLELKMALYCPHGSGTLRQQYTLLYSVILCFTPLYTALLCSTLLYSALLYSTLLYSALLCSTLLFAALLCSTLLYSNLL